MQNILPWRGGNAALQEAGGAAAGWEGPPRGGGRPPMNWPGSSAGITNMAGICAQAKQCPSKKASLVHMIFFLSVEHTQ